MCKIVEVMSLHALLQPHTLLIMGLSRVGTLLSGVALGPTA